MIERVVLSGYRRFANLDLSLVAGANLIVGDNECGKSTLLEAVSLALTGRVNGRWASEELNPFWFHRSHVEEFFGRFGTNDAAAPPEILIELYLRDDDPVQSLRGVHNSASADKPGVSVHIAPSAEYEAEFHNYMTSGPPPVLPVEYYSVDWRDFSDRVLVQRPKVLATAFIDARTIRSTSGVDYHTREMLSQHLDPKERTTISVAHRKSRQQITDEVLAPINERIAGENAAAIDRPIGLQMDQSSRTSWESGVVPQVDNVPFAMVGQGQQAALKVALAMSRTTATSTYVLVEEPENHLSHTTLQRLLRRLEDLATDDQQLLISTHSSFVLNRLGLDRLVLLHDGTATKFAALDDDTVAYFRKLAGYDTLRLVLAGRLALVEGPSDALVLERAIHDRTDKSPLDLGIDIVSMGGLTFRRALELCAALHRQVVGLQDNDGRKESDIVGEIDHLLDLPHRVLLVSDPAEGPTLEPQIVAVNEDAVLRQVLKRSAQADLATWMGNNKAEAALHILDSPTSIVYPGYIEKAVDLLIA